MVTQNILTSKKTQDHIIKFLKGVNEIFFSVCSQILMIDHLPSLNKTLTMVLGHKHLSNTLSISDNPTMAMHFHPTTTSENARGANSSRGRGRSHNSCGFSSTRVCTHYGDLLHEAWLSTRL